MITIYESIYDTSSPKYISLDLALSRIREGKQQEKVEKIRSGDKSVKQSLPVVLFSGKFTNRADDSLVKHSGIVVLDFDHINVSESKKVLSSDPYVKACWVSPSGDGLKALVKVTNPEKHRDHFRGLCDYFNDQYGLEVDRTGINESRACFESYDPTAVVKDKAEAFGRMVFETHPDQAELQVATLKLDTDYSKLNLAARMIRNAMDGDKHAILLKASILLGGFIAAGRVEEAEAVRLLEREISKKDIGNIDIARNTIRDGIARGKSAPISETVQAEEQIKREMMLNDGDMSFMSSDIEDLEWIMKFRNGELETGLSTGNVIIDRNFQFKREFTMISGHSSIGKTTFMIYMMISASINHGWKWIIYSAENKTASLKMKIIQFVTGRTIENLSMHEIKVFMRWMSEHFIIIDNTRTLSYIEVLLYAEKIARHNKVDGLLIDPYNSLRIDLSATRGVGVHEYHYEAATEFLNFSSRMEMAVWVNAHSVTSAQRKRDDDGHAASPGAADTEHGGKWVNRADNFIVLHRKMHHQLPERRREIEFHVEKIRNQETGGGPTPLDAPHIFKMTDDGCSFEIRGPFPRLFDNINSTDVEKQMEITDGV
tara:strand:- start:1383 stop:3182 length:1800 start_codon:yes stop_codon:yes gene_type:complete